MLLDVFGCINPGKNYFGIHLVGDGFDFIFKEIIECYQEKLISDELQMMKFLIDNFTLPEASKYKSPCWYHYSDYLKLIGDRLDLHSVDEIQSSIDEELLF